MSVTLRARPATLILTAAVLAFAATGPAGAGETLLFPKDDPPISLRGVGEPGEFRPSIEVRSVPVYRSVFDRPIQTGREAPANAIQITARPVEKLFFDVRYAAAPEFGPGPQNPNIDGHVGVKLGGGLTVGAFTGNTGAPDRWYGVDARLVYRNARFNASYRGTGESAAEDRNGEAETAWRLEGAYVLTRDGRPFAVPLLRFDQYESAAGPNSRDEVTFNIRFFPWENIQLRAEWWNQLTVPDEGPKDDRFSIQFDMKF